MSRGGRCFVLRGGGYFIQDVVIPEDAIGQYALLIGRAYTERTNIVKLGMSLAEVVSLFPANAGDANVRRALELSQSPGLAGPIKILVAAHKATNHDLADVKQFFFQFRNRRLSSLHVEYLSPQWESVDEFIEQRGHLLNLLAANSWEPVEGNSRSSKYLICEGIEIRFYAAPARSANLNYISVTDTSVEAVLPPPKLGQRAQP